MTGVYVAKDGTVVVCLANRCKGDVRRKKGTNTADLIVNDKYFFLIKAFASDSGFGVCSVTSDNVLDRYLIELAYN